MFVCPANYTIYDSICYGSGPGGNKDFQKAIDYCYENGQSNLTKLDHHLKMALATSYLDTNSKYWIGLKDVYNLNNAAGYIWIIDNSTTIGFNKWAPSQPGGPGEDCVYIKYTSNLWYWYTQSCNEQARVLCQKGKSILL